MFNEQQKLLYHAFDTPTKCAHSCIVLAVVIPTDMPCWCWMWHLSVVCHCRMLHLVAARSCRISHLLAARHCRMVHLLDTRCCRMLLQLAARHCWMLNVTCACCSPLPNVTFACCSLLPNVTRACCSLLPNVTCACCSPLPNVACACCSPLPNVTSACCSLLPNVACACCSLLPNVTCACCLVNKNSLAWTLSTLAVTTHSHTRPPIILLTRLHNHSRIIRPTRQVRTKRTEVGEMGSAASIQQVGTKFTRDRKSLRTNEQTNLNMTPTQKIQLLRPSPSRAFIVWALSERNVETCVTTRINTQRHILRRIMELALPVTIRSVAHRCCARLEWSTLTYCHNTTCFRESRVLSNARWNITLYACTFAGKKDR